MTSQAFEVFLAKIYVDVEAYSRFRTDPRGAGEAAGLSSNECDALATIDMEGLEMAVRSFASKREAKAGARPPARWFRPSSWRK